MWAAIIGDYIGSYYEDREEKGYNLKLLQGENNKITDDSILLTASAEAILDNKRFDESYRKWAEKYPDAGYGTGFSSWLRDGQEQGSGYSFGNGAAMRSSVIGFLFDNENEVLEMAERSAKCSHSHPEGIRGAQAVALTALLARQGLSSEEIKNRLYGDFEYLLFYDIDQLHRDSGFDSSAEVTTPIAIYIGLECESHEDCIRKCLHVGGDTDTIMSIAGAIAEARPGIELDKSLLSPCERYLRDNHPDVARIVDRFYEKYSGDLKIGAQGGN